MSSLSKEETIIKIKKEQEKQGLSSFLDISKEFLEMENSPKKRFCILLYFVFYSKLHFSSKSTLVAMQKIQKPSCTRSLTEKEEKEFSWKGEREGLSPVKIFILTIKELKSCFPKYIKTKDVLSFREISRVVSVLGDIPNSPNALFTLPLMSYYIMCRVMECAWNTYVGMPLRLSSMKAMKRLGWIGLNEKLPLKKERHTELENSFQHTVRPYVYSVLLIHSKTICFTNSGKLPSCEKCPVNTSCPSSSVSIPVHTYLDTLQGQNYFVEEKKSKAEVALASCTESEPEILSESS